jgi:two-component system, NtrC family, sensor kinase
MREFERQPTVLVVDDSASIRAYVCQLLLQAGYRVLEADDGSTCLLALQVELPDVVLLDVEMPVLSGLEVLRAQPSDQRLFSIVLFTTRATLEQIAAGLDLGADDYIVKPFNDVDLVARVRAATRNARQKKILAETRQESEAALVWLQRAHQKLVDQEKVGAVARLAAGAAHHINNPLGFVMSNLSTLERYAGSLLSHADRLAAWIRQVDPGAEPALGELEKSHRIRQIRLDLPSLIYETKEGGQRIALIVQQLAQLELGLANQKSQELDLANVLQPLVGMLTALTPLGTRVDWVPPSEAITVHGSLPLLNAALVALLKNACEALGNAPGLIKVTVVPRPDLAEIVIADSGAGVPEQDLPSLFDPFFTTKAPESHVGLGLTIAQRFIAGHGGRISLTSDASGTRVSIEIPRAVISPSIPSV